MEEVMKPEKKTFKEKLLTKIKSDQFLNYTIVVLLLLNIIFSIVINMLQII